MSKTSVINKIARDILRQFDAQGVQVNGVSDDSRKIRRGDLFMAYPGGLADGRRFVADAIARGAAAVLWEKSPDFIWDPAWTVVWYEDGIRKGKMEQRRGFDPLASQLYRGPEVPRKHPWADPWQADHLFRAAITPSANEIRVEATDGFGRVYTAVCR